MRDITSLSAEELTDALAYAGFVLTANNLMTSMIVRPIKEFYRGTDFGEGMPFKSYELDVKTRDKSEFKACLLYLRDFLEAIDDEDLEAVLRLRDHRNEIAHDFRRLLPYPGNVQVLWLRASKALHKISRHRAYMEIRGRSGFRGHRLGISEGS